jgi:hypothetical protein
MTVPFDSEQLREAGMIAASIHSREDLTQLPFTTKGDLRDQYPFGLTAVPMKVEASAEVHRNHDRLVLIREKGRAFCTSIDLKQLAAGADIPQTLEDMCVLVGGGRIASGEERGGHTPTAVHASSPWAASRAWVTRVAWATAATTRPPPALRARAGRGEGPRARRPPPDARGDSEPVAAPGPGDRERRARRAPPGPAPDQGPAAV